jgi:hypothetical protein
MSDYKDLNLYQKIQMVSDEIKNIEKKTEVKVTQTSSYKAVADIDVLLAVKKAETKYGLLSIPVKQELVKSEQVLKQDRNGYTSVTFADIVKMTVRIVNVDNPKDDPIEIESFGRGLDSGDKGFGKASTYARKYALLNAYKIATGEDPDEQASQQIPVATIDEKRNAVINYMLNNADFGQNVLQHFNLGDANDLNASQVETVYKNLQKKGLLK